MSESFEDEVRSALKAGVSDELTVGGLADGARAKARARRRTWSGALAAAVVVAAVPVGLAVLNNGGGPGGATTVGAFESAPVTGLPSGWHWESYGNIEFGVPDSWKHGSPNQWCVGGDLSQGWVSRPNEMQTLVYCEKPVNGFGATIGVNFDSGWSPGTLHQNHGGNYPDGAWMVYLSGGPDVLIAAPDQATAQQIADSFRTVDATDANGCATQRDIPRIGTAPAMTAPDSGPIVLCTYSGTASGDNLIGSDGLSADRAQALMAALDDARHSNGMALPDCASIDADATLILRGGEPLGWSFNTTCSDSGVDVGGGTVLPPIPAVLQAIYGEAPADPIDGGNVVTENPDGSVSNDGTAVPPDTGAPDSGSGGGTSGSSGGADPSSGMEVPPASPVK